MRNSWFFLMLLLVGCSSNGGEESAVSDTGQLAAQHVPEITGLTMSPDAVMQMEGDGNLAVTVEITFRDTGLDIQTLWVRMPDGTTIEFDGSIDTEAGTFTEDFVISTREVGIFTFEFRLVDKAGDTSSHRTADINVGWIHRLGGLPYTLNDVVWDGDVFIAVGSGGAILTSVDGIDWVERDSTTDANLNAIAYYGSDIFAAGNGIVLLSTDHGESWVTKAVPDGINLRAIANTASKVVAGGRDNTFETSGIMISEDRGDTWQEVDSWRGGFIQDLIYRDGLFVAATRYVFGGASLSVSSDGESWNEIVAEQRMGFGFEAIIHDGLYFIVTGYSGWTYASLDGFNWTVVPTPVREVAYLSAASNGSKIFLAGGYRCIPCLDHPGGHCPDPRIDFPFAISSTDGGLTWDLFNIDGDFESLGMAWGSGRFVSVGAGAIYTAD